MIKDKSEDFPVLGCLTFCLNEKKPCPKPGTSGTLRSVTSKLEPRTPSAGCQQSRNSMSIQGANSTSTPVANVSNDRPKGLSKVPTPPVSRCNASDLSMTKGSPIPCGDSFFEGESPFTQAQVNFVQNLQPANSLGANKAKKVSFTNRNSEAFQFPPKKDFYDDDLPDISSQPETPQKRLDFQANNVKCAETSSSSSYSNTAKRTWGSNAQTPTHRSQDSFPMDDVFDSQTFSDQFEDDLDNLIDLAERYETEDRTKPSTVNTRPSLQAKKGMLVCGLLLSRYYLTNSS